jgi:hypothetical protein
MAQPFPYALPQSLQHYAETFSSEPVKSVQRLEGFIKKRGNDPLAYLLLAWMYREQGQIEDALRYAQMAACFSPGTNRLQLAPYFFSHPDFFDAPAGSVENMEIPTVSGPSIAFPDLDQLIDQLSQSAPGRIEFDAGYDNDRDLSERTLEDAGDIASPTLAAILARQGKTTDALVMYQKLDGGSGQYAKEIEKLRSIT